MKPMANPMDALISYQRNLGDYLTNQTELDSGYLKLNGPKGAGYTYEYIKILEAEVQALAIFALEEPFKGVVRFSVGYAVAEKHRRRGLATAVINKGIEELKKEARAARVPKFFVEALIDQTNVPSVQVARKLFPGTGVPKVDEESGTPALLFYKLVEV